MTLRIGQISSTVLHLPSSLSIVYVSWSYDTYRPINVREMAFRVQIDFEYCTVESIVSLCDSRYTVSLNLVIIIIVSRWTTFGCIMVSSVCSMRLLCLLCSILAKCLLQCGRQIQIFLWIFADITRVWWLINKDFNVQGFDVYMYAARCNMPCTHNDVISYVHTKIQAHVNAEL